MSQTWFFSVSMSFNSMLLLFAFKCPYVTMKPPKGWSDVSTWRRCTVTRTSYYRAVCTPLLVNAKSSHHSSVIRLAGFSHVSAPIPASCQEAYSLQTCWAQEPQSTQHCLHLWADLHCNLFIFEMVVLSCIFTEFSVRDVGLSVFLN